MPGNVPPTLEPTSAGAANGHTPLDLQRAALRDLVALSVESATNESEIERAYHAGAEQAEKDFEKTTWTIRQRYENLRESVKAKHRETVAAIDAKFEEDSAAVEADTAPRVGKIERDFESLEGNVTQKLNQASWLAESVFDVAQNQAREEFKKGKERTGGHEEALVAMEARAFETVKRYALEPTPEPPGAPEVEDPQGAEAVFETRRDEAARRLDALRGLVASRLFVGPRPYLLAVLLALGAGAVALRQTGMAAPNFKAIGVAGGAALAVAVTGLVLLRVLARKQVARADAAFREALVSARKAVEAEQRYARLVRDAHVDDAARKRDAEVRRARNHFLPMVERAGKQRDEQLDAVRREYRDRTASQEAERERARRQADEQLQRHLAEGDHRRDAELLAARNKHEALARDSRKRYESARAALERRLRDGLAHIRAPIADGDVHGTDATADRGAPAPAWDDPAWRRWTPPREFPPAVRFGELRVDLKRVAESVPRGGQVRLELPKAFSMPAALGFPRDASLLVQADRALRDGALRTLQMVMTRLLTGVPPGRVRFTIIDPVGLGQSFAGFMRLADHDENLVGGRIWTEQDQIQQRLENLTGHMETVIQKYLRNEFETIDDYNAQAGELAEPYRFLVIADFPNSFTDEALRRLAAISSTGARCGVYTLIARDTRVPVPGETLLETLEAHSVNLVQDGDHFVWKDDIFGQFPLALDPPPGEEFLNRVLDVVGRRARDANRVEVSFESISPRSDQFWTGDATEEVVVPIGRMGATRLQSLRLGKGVAQHVLIAGKTGSGKSTLLHALVTNLAMWYPPEEVEFYLIDFKKGVEFKTYATHGLPHARAIAVESDREFGLSVLLRLDAELARRGDLFRKAGVQDLPAYRREGSAFRVQGSERKGSASASLNPEPRTLNPRMPRTLLIIDEFQEFFSEDDKLAQDASVLLDRLVRQGRAFGVHVLLGSQTIGGSSGLPRSTIGQMAVRIALQTSEADSHLILGDNNAAAKLLSRPGEAIYNDQGGLVEGNSPFQVAWLPDEKREQYLEAVRKRKQAAASRPASTIVFEGNAPADISSNAKLAALLNAGGSPAGTSARPTGVALAYLGEPVAIKDPTSIAFRRQSGSNALLVGQYDEPAKAMMAAMMISLAAQRPVGSATFYVVDGTPADSPLAGVFAQVRGALPHDVKLIDYRSVPGAINEIAAEVQRRRDDDGVAPAAPDVYVFVYALQRYRALRKSEDSFGFGSSDESKAPDPGKQFVEVLRDGPPVGVHVIAWADTAVAVDRTLDRHALREFDHRVLFQMSATDSSNLIDSPAANKLGLHRALAYSEEQGVTEKFRPYALPDRAWLQRVKEQLSCAVEAK